MKKAQKLCRNCKEKPVYCRQALYCKACSKTVAKAQRRKSNQRRRSEQYKAARLKPRMISLHKLTWDERREQIRACIQQGTHAYTNRLTPQQMREMQGAAA